MWVQQTTLIIVIVPNFWPFRHLNSFVTWIDDLKNKWISNLYLSWSSYHGNVPPNMEMTISHRLSIKRLPILKPRPEVCYSFLTKIRNSPRHKNRSKPISNTSSRWDKQLCSEIFRSNAYIKNYRPKVSKLTKTTTFSISTLVKHKRYR